MGSAETIHPLDCEAVRERLRRHLERAPSGLPADHLERYVTSVELLEDARACGFLPHGRNRFFLGLIVALALSGLLWAAIILIAMAVR